jgi:hypothetical protein
VKLLKDVRDRNIAYEPAIQYLYGLEKPDYHSAVSRLWETEQRFSDSEKKATAYSAYNSNSNSNSTSSSGSNSGAGKSKKKPKPTPPEGFEFGECWHCHSKEHRRPNCSKWLETKDGKEFLNRKSSGKAQKSTPEPEKAQKSTSGKPGAWYSGSSANYPTISPTWCIDSGAAYHMTPEIALFKSIEDLASPILVNTASGITIKATQKGVIRLQLDLHGDIHDITVQDVLLMPDLSVSLLSVSQLRNRGIIFDISDAPVLRLNGDVVATVSEIGGTFFLNTKGLDIQEPDQSYALSLRARPTEDIDQIHRIFGHIGLDKLSVLHRVVTGVPTLKTQELAHCEPCILARQLRVQNRKSSTRATARFWRLHVDVWGPYSVESLGRNSYMYVAIDDATRYSWVGFGKDRTSIRSWLFQLILVEERRLGARLSAIRTDNASELIAMSDELLEKGIRLEPTIPYTPEQNGSAERLNRTLITIAKAFLFWARLPHRFWEYAAEAANYVRNRGPTGPNNMSPIEALRGKKPNIKELHTFGCLAYTYIPREKRLKLEPKSMKSIFIGYTETTQQYRVYLADRNMVIRSSNVIFVENEILEWNWGPSNSPGNLDEYEEAPDLGLPTTDISEHTIRELLPTGSSVDRVDSQEIDPESDPESDSQSLSRLAENEVEIEFPPGENEVQLELPDRNRIAPIFEPIEPIGHGNRSRSLTPGSVIELEPQETIPEPIQDSELRRSTRSTRGIPRNRGDAFGAIAAHTAYFTGNPSLGGPIGIPSHYQEAIQDPILGKEWRAAMEDELFKLNTAQAWEITELPIGRKPVGSRWVFTAKPNKETRGHIYKARLVAQGYSQVPGDDYSETFSPTIRIESLRALLAIGASENYEIEQWDVVQAYIQAPLQEEIYMRAPDVMNVPAGKVLHLRKAMYGLKQSGRAWYRDITLKLNNYGLFRIESDWSIFTNQDRTLILGVYVDDIVVLGSSLEPINSLKKHLLSYYKLKYLGSIEYCLGLHITRDRSNRTLTIDQESYIRELLLELGVEKLHGISTPISDYRSIGKPIGDEPRTDQVQFHNLIGKLSWISNCTRPDITFTVNRLAQLVQNPTMANWNAAMRVLRYLKSTIQYKLIYSDSSALVGYTDADYASNSDRHSVIGYTQFLCGGPISWTSRRQRSIATSTAESEYISLCLAAKQTLWLRNLLLELGFLHYTTEKGKYRVLCDNQGAIALSENPENHSRSKHIDIQYHYVRELVASGELIVEYCPTKEMLADILTKPIPEPQYKALVSRFFTTH